MHSSSVLSVISRGVVLVAAVAPALAQRGPDIFVTPVPGAPFSAVVYVQRTAIRRDGRLAALQTSRIIGRDSSGRIHNESRQLLPQNSTSIPPVLSVHLYDPGTRTTAILNPREKIYWTSVVDHPPATEPPDRLASPSSVGIPASQFANEQDLGTKEMGGLAVHGVRETQTLQDDRGREIVVTDEYWYSEDLRINLVVKHSDPRDGAVTMTVANVSRKEPPLSLFEIPGDYKPASGRPENGQ